MINKIALALSVILTGIAGYSAVNDQILIFSTPGIDCYADGSVVRDGEFYAVVCAPKAQNPDFYGFTSDGNLIDPVNNRLICRLAKAKDGRCPRTTLSVPAGMLSGQVYVVMMDTRSIIDDLPGRGNVVRGYAVAASGQASDFASVSGDFGAFAVTAKLPSDIPKPVITGFRIDNGWAYLTVSKTVPGVYYRVCQGSNLARDCFTPVADEYARSDSGNGTVQFVIPVENGNAGFFRIGIRPLDGSDNQ